MIAGNKTLESAADLGLPIEVVQTDGHKLVVVQRTDMDLSNGDSKARELAYADNRSSEVGMEWDVAQIAADLEAGVDLDSMFRKDELDEILKDIAPKPEEPPGPQMDRAEELREKWQTERGQVWEIGEHRLMCGDAEKDLGEFTAGRYALMFTDPPYGISVVKSSRVGGAAPTRFGKVGGRKIVASSTYRRVEGDDKPFDPQHLFGRADDYIMWGGNYYSSKLEDSRCWIVWDKDNTGNFADAELAWTSFDKGVCLYKHTWNGLVREGARDVEGVKRFHPTQKPVGLHERILKDFSEEGDAILDPYLGSGTTLLACERTSRKCNAMEIDPAYVAVALERMTDMGLAPALANG